MHKLVALSVFLIPAIALAQPTSDPFAPPPTTTTVIVEPSPGPIPVPPPVIIVNPPPQTPVRAYVASPQYETVYDAYNAPVFTTGALVFLASYGSSVIVAASAGKDEKARGTNRLYIPIAGPWLALNDRGTCAITSSACDHETTKKVLLVADGIFQATGLLTIIDGVLMPSAHRVVVQDAKLDTKVHLIPAAVGEHGDPGIAAFGRF